jgi:hypothetical protein
MAVSLLALGAGPLLSGCAGSDRGSRYGEGVGNEQGAYQDDEVSGDHFWRRASAAHNRE